MAGIGRPEMRWKPTDFTRELNASFRNVTALLFYGPDRGLSLENMNAATDKLLPNGDDGFSLFDFSADDIRANPSRLVDEAYAISFSAGRKVIRIKDAGTETSDAMAPLLKRPDPPPAVILVLSAELPPSSPLRGMFEREAKLAALPSYLDDATTLAATIRRTLSDVGLKRIPTPVVETLVSLLGENRATTRSELEKLSLYLHGREEITMEDVEKCVMDTSQVELSDLPIAIALGDAPKIATILPRLFNGGVEPATLARTVGLHFKSLYFMREELDNGRPMDEILKARKIFWKLEEAYGRQIHAWTPDKILKAISRLQDLEIMTKTTGVHAEATASQIFFYLAAGAGKK